MKKNMEVVTCSSLLCPGIRDVSTASLLAPLLSERWNNSISLKASRMFPMAKGFIIELLPSLKTV